MDGDSGGSLSAGGSLSGCAWRPMLPWVSLAGDGRDSRAAEQSTSITSGFNTNIDVLT